jgi:outer membrane protein assembly factor BamD
MKRSVCVLSLLLLTACAGRKEPDLASFSGRSDRIVWDAGQKALAKKDWLTAREHFRRVVDGFPNSEYAPQARMALGDTYLREGGTANLILAISEYRQFLTLYPSHPQSDYAQLQVAECFFKQKNGPDRDQTPTKEALAEYQRLVDQHPASPHTETAKARIAECRYSLARSEHIVGFFYQRTRQSFRSAITRYETVLAQYPEYPHLDEVLFRLGESLVASGRNPEAAPHLQRLLDKYPDSRFLPEARKLLARATAPAPAATPTSTAKLGADGTASLK